jgi:putative ABC transport system permease protein
MFSSYLIIAFQSLKKQPGFSAIKILSLAIGFACSVLVIMHVQYSTSFDKHFPNWENTYRLVTSLTTDQRLDTVMTSDAYAPQMALDYPQIEHIAKIRPSSGLFSTNDDDGAITSTFYWAEPDIIPIFSLEFISGNAEGALSEPNVIVLSESSAEIFFPAEDALGQTMTLDDQTDLRVIGVMKDLPENTHFELEMIISVETGRQIFNENFMGGNSWVGFQGTLTYLTLADQAERVFIDADLANFVEKNLPDEQRTFAGQAELTLSLQSIADIYLSPRQGFGQASNPRAQVLTGLMVFAILILVTSCINFGNLSLAQVRQRGKEIGIRKTLGANRGQIIIQFLFESLLLTLVALAIALPLIYFALPVYTTLTSTEFTFASVMQSSQIIGVMGFVLATGLLSGLLPAFVLSRFQVSSIISNVNAGSRLNRLLRASVTVVQFSFSTALVIVTTAIVFQINYMNTMNLGFNKDELLLMDSTFSNLTPENFNYSAMVNELEQHPGVLSVATVNAPPPSTGPLNPWSIPSFAPDEFRPVNHKLVSSNYIETMQFTFLAGRDFSEEFPADFVTQPVPGEPNPPPEEAGIKSIVITRYAASNFGFDSPEAALNEIFVFFGYQYRVIGVIENYQLLGALEDALRPTSVLRATLGPLRPLVLRLDGNQRQSALDHIDSVWSRHRPDVPINRTFYDQTYNDAVYETTNGINKAAIFASIITVLISAFGLYALAYYSTQRRTKEIGVRKVLGASSNSIVTLLSWGFLKPVLIACIISWGIAFIGITQLFQSFSSRVELSFMLYVGITLGTLAVALLTVAFQCFNSANSDPVESLRYE